MCSSYMYYLELSLMIFYFVFIVMAIIVILYDKNASTLKRVTLGIITGLFMAELFDSLVRPRGVVLIKAIPVTKKHLQKESMTVKPDHAELSRGDQKFYDRLKTKQRRAYENSRNSAKSKVNKVKKITSPELNYNEDKIWWEVDQTKQIQIEDIIRTGCV